MKKLIWLMLVVIIACKSPVANNTTLKVVLIAGPNDHCPNGRSCHKYIQDMQLIRDCLLQQPGVAVELLIADRPKMGSLDDVDVVVVHSSGDDTEYEWNALFPRVDQAELYKDREYAAFLKYFDNRMDQGMGLVTFHYATAVNHPESIMRYKKWIGGYFNEESSRVDGDEDSEGSTAIECVIFKNPNNPVLRGVSPWKSEAEYYFKMDIQEQSVPVLASNLPINDPKEEIIAWALERPDGGRGFGFTGCHNHNNLYLDDFRKFVLNVIFWTGKSEIPPEGIQSRLTKRYFR